MKQEAEFCNLVKDKNNLITDWVCRNLMFDKPMREAHFTVGIMKEGKLIGGLIYHNIRPYCDLFWTIYTKDKRWCSRRILQKIFHLAFNVFKVKRISLLITTDNQECINLVQRLGFKKEGLLRSYRDDGKDAYFYGMLATENKWKGKIQMSKAIGKILGAGGASTSMLGSEQDIINYLNNYNTTNYDNTLNNLTSFASTASNQLNNMGDYNFSIDGSDSARQRAEQASYQSYLNKLQPQFANQTADLTASLANKGIGIGTEAYSRAMTDLQNSQNNALNQAAYQSVLAGQNAFSNSLSDQMNAASFANQSQANYINMLLSALQNSYSGYDNALNKYQVQKGADARIDQNRMYNAQAQQAAGDSFLQSAAQAAALAMMSDIRLKENIKAVGKLDNGLTVYCFNFKGDSIPRIGLLAQEVQKVNPRAVVNGNDGFLCVRYDLACANDNQKEEEKN